MSANNPTATEAQPRRDLYQLVGNYYDKADRRSETRVVYTFGHTNQVDPEALRRLVRSIMRVANDDRIDLPALRPPPEVDIGVARRDGESARMSHLQVSVLRLLAGR